MFNVCRKDHYFAPGPWDLFGILLGWFTSLGAHLACSNGVPKSIPNYVKHIVSDFFGDPLGTPIWTMWTKQALPCSVVLVLRFLRSAPMQRGIRFAFCDMLPMQCGARFAFCRSAPMQLRTSFALSGELKPL